MVSYERILWSPMRGYYGLIREDTMVSYERILWSPVRGYYTKIKHAIININRKQHFAERKERGRYANDHHSLICYRWTIVYRYPGTTWPDHRIACQVGCHHEKD